MSQWSCKASRETYIPSVGLEEHGPNISRLGARAFTIIAYRSSCGDAFGSKDDLPEDESRCFGGWYRWYHRCCRFFISRQLEIKAD